MTVGQFHFEQNSVLRSSIVDQSDGTDPKNDDLASRQEAELMDMWEMLTPEIHL